METMGAWIVGIIIVCIIGLAAGKIYKDHKSGKGCGNCCEGCSHCSSLDDLKSSDEGGEAK